MNKESKNFEFKAIDDEKGSVEAVFSVFNKVAYAGDDGNIEITGKNDVYVEAKDCFEKVNRGIFGFNQVLDNSLKDLNSDYEAKRHKNIALDPPIIHVVNTGVFDKWLKKKNRLGGQNKIPRLANNRNYLDEILSTI